MQLRYGQFQVLTHSIEINEQKQEKPTSIRQNINVVVPSFVGRAIINGLGWTNQFVIRNRKIQTIKPAKNFRIVKCRAPSVEENLRFIDSRKIKNRNRGSTKGVEAPENLTVVFETRRQSRDSKLGRTAINVVVDSLSYKRTTAITAITDFLRKRGRTPVGETRM